LWSAASPPPTARSSPARPVREASARMNAALQAAYFIVGVRAAGLAAGPMTGFDFAAVQKEFLDDDHTPLMIVNLGRAAGDAPYPRSPRLAYDEVVTTV
ncbi:nitroreductase family protein, partial [Streptomyces fradiae]|uniref:nitroreductase family protein n=1 Tax=Streptomyces fradiae TaxID=1906 RepID=UPI003676FA2F